MRKRNITKIADTVFWYTVYLLPVIAYLMWLISACRNPGLDGTTITEIRGLVNFGSFCVYSGFEVFQQNPIFVTLREMFATSNSIFPLFNTNVLLLISWFVSMHLVHLFVDFLLFIPRFAMKYMDEFTKE